MVFDYTRTVPPQYAAFPGIFLRNLGWKMHRETTLNWFEGRVLNRADVDRKTYDNSGQDELLRSGPPKFTRPITYSNLAQYWGPQILNAAGFINNLTTKPTISGPKGLFARQHDDGPLHPILRREMWQTLLDSEWDALQPSLHFATSLLDTPDVLRFFATMWSPYDITYAGSGYVKKFRQLPPTLDTSQFEFVYRRLCDMRNYTSFQFMEQSEIDRSAGNTETVGMTVPRDGVDGFWPGTTLSSHIYLSRDYLSGLEVFLPGNVAYTETYINHEQQHDISPDRRIHIDAASCKLRLQLRLAVTIIHELAHAMNFATDVRPEDGRVQDNIEPFHPGEVVAEVGFAWEKSMLGGAVQAGIQYDTPDWMRFIMPFGATLFTDPMLWVLQNGSKQTEYPVHMGWIASMFDGEFWEQRVQRFGGQVLRYQWPDGWAVVN